MVFFLPFLGDYISPIPPITLPETNSLPLKIGRNPKGNDRIPFPSIFRCYVTVSFREGFKGTQKQRHWDFNSGVGSFPTTSIPWPCWLQDVVENGRLPQFFFWANTTNPTSFWIWLVTVATCPYYLLAYVHLTDPNLEDEDFMIQDLMVAHIFFQMGWWKTTNRLCWR